MHKTGELNSRSINVRKAYFVAVAVCVSACAYSAPFNSMQQLQDSFSDLRYQVGNHEIEIHTVDEKLKSLDAIIESLRDQLRDASKAHKEQLKVNSTTLEGKITSLEAICKDLVADLKQFKNHSNETASALGQYKQKIGELEKMIDQQNQNIEHLQTAMRSLMEVLQNNDTVTKTADAAGGNTYRVQSGDSLEKIARKHQTTVQALKDLNGITGDKIVVGKLLLIPEK